MKSISASVYFAILLLVFSTYLISGSYGLKCYLCSSDTDKRCGDPFNRTSNDIIPLRTDECHPTYYPGSQTPRFVCRKIKERLTNNEIKVSRMCVQDGQKENDPCSLNSLSTFLKVEHCSTCATDLCNSAVSVFQVSASFVGPVIILASKLNFI